MADSTAYQSSRSAIPGQEPLRVAAEELVTSRATEALLGAWKPCAQITQFLLSGRRLSKDLPNFGDADQEYDTIGCARTIELSVLECEFGTVERAAPRTAAFFLGARLPKVNGLRFVSVKQSACARNETSLIYSRCWRCPLRACAEYPEPTGRFARVLTMAGALYQR